MHTEVREIEAPQDFELGRPRAAPLRYTVSWPRKGAPKGLVFIIPGFGGDVDPQYGTALRRTLVEAHDVAAVHVRYHCFESRPATGAAITLDAQQHLFLVGLAAVHGLQVKDYNDLGELTAKLQTVGSFPVDARLVPGGGEHQNFGVLQAMDHLAVLGDLLARGPGFDVSRVVAFGSSHGGYIAHMIAKLAPGTLAAVVDNSAYVEPPMDYLGLGAAGECVAAMGGAQLRCRVDSAWTFDAREAPNFYDRDRDLIRHTGFLPHLEVLRAAAPGAGPRFLMVNSTADTVSPPAAKSRQAAAMQAAGLRARLDLIGPDQIDGRVFKAPGHGLDASLKKLFARMAPDIDSSAGRLDCATGAVVTYPCVEKAYRFVHSDRAPYVRGETFDLYPAEAGERAAA